MERYLMEQLVAWKSKANRKPLILNGARQVGKTWLLKEFGKREFDNVAYVSLDSNQAASALFDEGFDAQRVLMGAFACNAAGDQAGFHAYRSR